MSDNPIERTLEEVGDEAEAAAEDFPTEVPSHVKVSRGHGRTRTLQVRLNDDELAALEQRADARGLPASTLARALLLEAMAVESSKEQKTATLHRLIDELAAAS